MRREGQRKRRRRDGKIEKGGYKYLKEYMSSKSLILRAKTIRKSQLLK